MQGFKVARVQVGKVRDLDLEDGIPTGITAKSARMRLCLCCHFGMARQEPRHPVKQA